MWRERGLEEPRGCRPVPLWLLQQAGWLQNPSGPAVPSARGLTGRARAGSAPRPAPGPARATQAPVPGPAAAPAPASRLGTSSDSWHTLEHGRGWFWALCISLLGRQWVRREVAVGNGAPAGSRRADLKRVLCALGLGGVCVCVTAPCLSPCHSPCSSLCWSTEGSGASSPTLKRIPPLPWPEPPCVGGTPQGQPWGRVSQKTTHHLRGSVITLEQEEAAGFG